MNELTREELLEENKKLKEKLENIDKVRDYSQMLSELKLAMFESNPEGKITNVNHYGIKMFGYQNIEEVQSKSLVEDFYYNKNDRNEFIKRIERVGFVRNFEVKMKKRDGRPIMISISAFANKDDSGKTSSYFGLLRDVTESRSVEDQLKVYVEKLAQLNRKLVLSEEELKKLNASKDKFFSIIAHDLRSPFTSLLGLTEFLVHDIDDLEKEEVKNFSQKIYTSSKNIFELLENLLQWARLQSDKVDFNPHIFNLNEIVEQISNTLIGMSVKKNIKIINNLDKMQRVFADKTMIYSVLNNLITNAVKFTRPGGKVEIKSKITDNNILIEVIDSGIGIPEEDINKLFEIDQNVSTLGTADEKGTGLGLILCKELVEKNGGEICVDSKEGEGSMFYFTLPIQPINQDVL